MFHPSERWFTRTLARKHRDCSLKANRRHLVLESLEDRVVLSVVDLTTAGSTGTINGAIYAQGNPQPAGSGVFQPFVRLDNTGVEAGYNTDARGGSGSHPYADTAQIGTDSVANFDHSLLLSAVPIVSVNGSLYREFILNINQNNNLPLLSLDEVQVSLSSSPTLGDSSSTYYSSDGTYNHNATLVYDMNNPGGGSNWVKLNGALSQGSGKADMFLDIPLGDFTGATGQYVYLYSHFGTQILNGTVDVNNGGSANDGQEYWSAPSLGSNLSTTNTTIYLGATGTTSLPSPVPAFSTVHDSATVTGSNRTPTGTVTFLFYTTIDGTGTPAGAGTVTLDANGVANPSDAEGPLNPGNYSFKAVYNGDSTYLPSVSPVEPLTIGKASPSLSTTILSPTTAVTAGNVTVQDRATISGGFNPTGTLSFVLDDANNTAIAGTSYSTTFSAAGNYDTPAGVSVSLAAGTYHWVVSATGDANNNAPPDVTNETFTVGKASPSLSTTILQPSGAVTAGNVTVQDEATIAGGFNPTGTLSFVLDDANNTAIAGTSYSTTFSAAGNYDTPAGVSVSLAAGTYHWVVSATGDANNNAPPDVTNETFTVGKASPSLSTTILQPSGAVTAGNVTVQDEATIAGGFNPTGTLSFVLDDANNTAIAGTSYSTTFSAAGNYDTPAGISVSLAAGTYHWVVSATGDANNNAPPDVTNETFTVGKASPSLSTTILQPSGAVTAGNVTVQDEATIAGGFNPTGTLSFVLDDANNTAIAGTSYSTTFSAAGNYDTPAGVSVSLAAGTYHWVVSATGDANNNAPPDVTNETFTVGKASPSLSTTILQPSGAVTAGNVTVQDEATIAGGFNPTGTLSFVLDDANNTAIAGTSYSTTFSAAGNYDTPAGVSVSLAAGTYHWVVSATGDANNNAPPDVTNETFTVGKASPSLSTTILQPSGAVTAGNVTVQDEATIAGGFNPTGTLSFVLDDANNTAIAGTSYSTTFSAAGNYDTPAGVSVSLAAGTYHWVVSATGDANNNAPPDVTNETFTVGKASPSLSTTILQPSGAVTAGNVTVQDEATIAGGFNPTGTLSFVLDDANNTAIAGTSYSTTFSAAGNYDTPAGVSVSLAAGTYHWVVSATGDANNNAPPDVTNETFTVGKASPSLSTTILQPSGAVTAGNVTVQDEATIAGGFNPTGTLSFVLDDANNTAIAGTSYSTTFSAAGNYDTPAGVSVSLAAGTYHWVVSATGDANNNAPPDVTNETFTVGKASPSLSTTILQPSGAVTAGNVTVQDEATIAGGFNPTGTLSFVLDDANNTAIAGTSYSTTFSAAGNYDTPAGVSVSLAAGTYHWVVSATGDANNNAPPDVTNETFTVGKASPTLDTTILQPSGAVTAGNVTVQDEATIAGGFSPTGTLSFVLDDATNNPIAGTSFSTAVTGNKAYDTTAVTVSLAAGTYHWVVSYTGDANNNAPPDVTNETFTIPAAAPPLITTTIHAADGAAVSGPVPLGTSVYDTATLSGFGSTAPTGTVTYTFVDISTGALSGTETVQVGSNGSVPNSTPTPPLHAGSYTYQAQFIGNGFWNGVTATSDPETLTVNQATPSVSTTIHDSVTNLPPPAAGDPLGSKVYDTATVTGIPGFTPTGTVTYNFYNTATPVYGTTVPSTTETVTLAADGTVPKSAVTAALAAGSYSYIAVYSADSNYTSKVGPVEPLTVIPGPVNPDGPRIIRVVRFGIHHQPTTLVLEFDQPLDPVPAIDVHNYHITGPAGRSIAIASAQYDPSTDVVTLHPTKRINLHYTYTLTVSGTGPNGLTDTDGRLLDGNDDGKPGGNFKTTITWRNLVLGSPPTRSITSRIPAYHKGRPIPPKYPLHKGRSWQL